MILAIDPGNIESAYVIIDKDYKPIKFEKVKNELLLTDIYKHKFNHIQYCVIEKIASYGMAVGAEVFDTCIWIGRFCEALEQTILNVGLIPRKDVKMNLCNSNRAKDSNVTQSLVDRFAYGQSNYGKGTKKKPGWFYGFSKDIWQAYALGVTYKDKRNIT